MSAMTLWPVPSRAEAVAGSQLWMKSLGWEEVGLGMELWVSRLTRPARDLLLGGQVNWTRAGPEASRGGRWPAEPLTWAHGGNSEMAALRTQFSWFSFPLHPAHIPRGQGVCAG